MKAACRVCGRPLCSEKWAALRIGPICARATRARTTPPAPHPARSPDTNPAQTEIPLPPMQPLLWSPR